MATKTFDELKQLAIQIRDEKTNKQNTANRVGTAMLEGINKLEQDYYDKTTADKELKKRDDKLTEIANNVGLYNVDKHVPLGGGFYTSATARAAVPSDVRKIGLIITYKTDATTSVTEQFIGSDVSGWTTDTNWKNVGSEGGNKILEWKNDAATTRKEVPVTERKAGMQISYKPTDSDWVNEQYIGTYFTDTEWVKDSNWEKIPKQKQLTELDDNIINSYSISILGKKNDFKEINIDTIKENTIIKNGIESVYNNRATTDYINVEAYQGLQLVIFYAGNFNDSDSYAFYDKNKNVLYSVVDNNINNYAKILIPVGCYYTRISCLNSNIDKLKLYADSQTILSNEDIINIKKSLSLINTVEKSVVGYAINSSSLLAKGYGLELPPKKYTRVKIITDTNKTVSFGITVFDKNLNLFVPLKTISIDVTTDNEYYDIDLNLLGFDKCYLSAIEGLSWTKSNLQDYKGVAMFRGIEYGSPLESSLIQEYNSGTKYYFSIDLFYEEKDNEFTVEKMNLSETLKGKDYVAYGDSITFFAKEDETGDATYGKILADYFGFNFINKSKSGSVPQASGHDNCNLTDDNLTAVTENTRLVTISGGQNGWVTSEDINTLDRSTSIGAINYYIDKIREISPKCIIILCPTYIQGSNLQSHTDYPLIAENKHVGIAPTLDLRLIDWVYDKTVQILRYDNIHLTGYGARRYSAIVREYARQFFF